MKLRTSYSLSTILVICDDVLSHIGSMFDPSEAPLILMTGGLPPALKENANQIVGKTRRLQKWWRHVRLPSEYDPSWCLTTDSEWSCRLGERMYKRFMLTRFPLEHMASHSIALAWALLHSDHLAEAVIYTVEDEDDDYFVSDVDTCALDGSLHSWKTMVKMADAQAFGTIGL